MKPVGVWLLLSQYNNVLYAKEVHDNNTSKSRLSPVDYVFYLFMTIQVKLVLYKKLEF